MATERLLRCGVMAGPLYLALGVGQGLLREGFSFERHPLSVLANGTWGWVQTANFLVSGLLVIAATVGVRRVLGPGSRALVWTLGAYGAGLIAAACFPADPVDGFPPGTPPGFPTAISTTGLIHFIVGALTFTFLGVSGLCGAWTLWRRRPSLAWLSLFSGVSVLGGFFGGFALPVGVAGIWLAVVIGWIWLSVITARLSRA